jgi:BirA family transcriptional regulator, biotin operon repressor / biotin---[acetyl-CoA-carboxylase] ligase
MSGNPHDGPHLHWGAETLWQRLQPLLPGLGVEVVARADSTNTRLLERARRASGKQDGRVSRPGEFDPLQAEPATPLGRRADDVMPCLLVAEHQTDGRGRLGRDWHASAGNSLTFSLALTLAPRGWSGMSLAVGLALADALEPATGARPRIGLKWPNDLWLWEGPGAGRKLGGILIETIAVGEHRLCVVGVGLNVAPQPQDGPSAGSACLQELLPGIDAPAALACVAEPLVRGLLAFRRCRPALHGAMCWPVKPSAPPRRWWKPAWPRAWTHRAGCACVPATPCTRWSAARSACACGPWALHVEGLARRLAGGQPGVLRLGARLVRAGLAGPRRG